MDIHILCSAWRGSCPELLDHCVEQWSQWKDQLHCRELEEPPAELKYLGNIVRTGIEDTSSAEERQRQGRDRPAGSEDGARAL